MNCSDLYKRMQTAAAAWAAQYKLPFLAGLLTGLAAHMYAMTNKLLNADEVSALFTKGALLGSGRWGLLITGKLLPSFSMPWLWGLVSLIMISLAACITLSIFKIKSPAFRMLVPAAMTSLPAVTSTLCYMFTAADYFAALLFAVLGVKLAADGKSKYKWAAAAVLLILMLGIYQAYILLAASYFMLLMIKALFENKKSTKEIFIDGVKYVLLLVGSLLVYFLISRTIIQFTTDYFPDYAFSHVSPLYRIRTAYTAFIGILFRGYFGFVSSGFSRAVHCAAILAAAYLCALWFFTQKDKLRLLLFAVLIALLPLCIDGIYLIADVNIIYASVLFSFFSVYLLAVIAAENVSADKKAAFTAIIKAALALTIAVNVIFANKIYLKEYLMYEEAHAFYTGVVTRIQSCEGYGENSRVAIIGNTDNIYRVDEIDSSDFSPAPVNRDMVNIYTRDVFIKYYVGFEPEYASKAEIDDIISGAEFEAMPLYPYYGSVKMIGDVAVVKLGNG